MSSVNQFLKILEKVGYPNPDTQSIAKMVGYNLDFFLLGIRDKVGEDGVEFLDDRFWIAALDGIERE